MSDKKELSQIPFEVFSYHDQINYQMIFIVIGTTEGIDEFQKLLLKPDKLNPIKARGALDKYPVSSLLENVTHRIRHAVIYINKDYCKKRMTRTLYHELLHLYDAVHDCIYYGEAGPKPSQNELLVRVMTSFVFDTPLSGALKYAIEYDSDLAVNSIKL